MMNRVCLFIAGSNGYEVLSRLLSEGYGICGVLILVQQSHELNNFTQKIINFCAQNNIYYQDSSEVKPKDYASFLERISPDIVFTIDWRYLIPEKAFNIPRFGIFVLHDSLLPKYRGFAPTNWVIINGEKETGLTLQYAHQDTDAGDIVDQIKIKIENDETATTLRNKISKIYPEIILKNIKLILKGKNKRRPQNTKSATYACKRIPDDGRIDFNQSTKKILRLIRALSYPYPGAFCFFKDKKIIIWEAEQLKNAPVYVGRISGRPVKITDEFVDILTGDGILRVKKLSFASAPNVFLAPNVAFNTIAQSVL